MFRSLSPMVKNLLIINLAMYVVTDFLGMRLIKYELMLHSFHSPEFQPYQLFTHMFLHGGFSHLLFNMLGLFFLGPLLERVWGPNRFLLFYLVCGVGAAVLYASISYFQMLFPNTEFMLLFPPIPLKAKYLALGLGLIALFSGLNQSPGDNVAHFAHLGGMLFAFILLKIWQRRPGSFY
jgi:membrane associated rhomboid family serine protease